MHKVKWQMALLIVLSISLVFLVSTLDLAQGKGKGRSDEPPGWQKGEKKGWKGDAPPGIEKKGGWMPPGLSKEEQVEWKGGRPPGWARGRKELMNILPPGLRKGSAKGVARKFELAERDHSKAKEKFFKKKEELKDAIKKMQNAKTKEEKKRLEGEKDRIEAEKNALEERLQKTEEAKENAEKELENEREKFKTELKNTKDIIKKRAAKMRFSPKEKDEILASLEISSRFGVPPRQARSIIEAAMNKGMKGEGIERVTRAVAYGVGREVNFDQLGKFVHKKLGEGLRDDELSIEICKEVARRHEERLKAKEAIQQKKERGKQ